MTVVAATAGALAVVVALLRWLRVCQREHYIAGACVRFAGRWIRVRPINAGLATVTGAALCVGSWAEIDGRTGMAALSALAVAGSAAVFPWPMRLLGEPRLRFTRRLTRLSAISVLASVAVAMVGALLVGPRLAVAIASALVPAVVDMAAAVAAPIEKRLLLGFRRRAEARLSEVSPTVIAVTGSWGKTSTKQHIRDLLTGDAALVASPASYNNAAGLSKTINEHVTGGTEVLVAEMGMYKPGEIRDLCSWIRPHVAVITAIGPMHLERAGSIERIAAAKAEILERADTAVLWVDDPHLAALAESCSVARVRRVGSRGGDGLDVEVEVLGDEIVVSSGGTELGRCPPTSGLHPGNVGCAVAAAEACGASPQRLRARLAMLRGPAHRSEAHTGPEGILVMDDTFNSNPVGASAAIEALGRLVEGRRVVVTPGMVELGSEQNRANTDLGAAVVTSGATLLVVGWTNRRALLEGAGLAGGDAVTVRDRSEARDWIRNALVRGDGVLWENDLPDHYP
ncbi:MAG: Mur ligase family protein [Acidimicrobiaceae bacterium]|nr:Mur ligase family protein [Acidimicrobiaceae bacterium]